MRLKLKQIAEQTIVITGATSGIGLVTARMAARRGARVVAAARTEESLKELERELSSTGSEAAAVRADVSNAGDLRMLAGIARSRFGSIDTWVNNAGVSIFGEIMDVPVEEERKLFETNYWGLVNGSRIAVENMREKGGALINLGSVASDHAIPLQGAYCASKHAVKAFTDTLRIELEHRNIPISVTLIKPTAIDTPFFRHASTYMEAQPTEPSPMYAPEEVARAILHAAEHPIRHLLVGDTAMLQSAMGRVAPRLGDRFMKATMFSGQKDPREPQPGENRAISEPSGDLRERGDYGGVRVMERSLVTRASMHPAITMAAVGAGLALAAALTASRKK